MTRCRPGLGWLDPSMTDQESTGEVSMVRDTARRYTFAPTASDHVAGSGISDEFGLIRPIVDPEVVNIRQDTHDIHALIPGLPAFDG
ncbi:MAG: hypothetical protein KDH15_08265 [Rhodocyclaceae bacterium]|nr:hypothetical protein [Rhodocyclaceae bacterium]